jgi:hypothetical protein
MFWFYKLLGIIQKWGLREIWSGGMAGLWIRNSLGCEVFCNGIDTCVIEVNTDHTFKDINFFSSTGWQGWWYWLLVKSMRKYVAKKYGIMKHLNLGTIEPVPIGLALFTTYTSCMGMGTSYYHPSTPILNAPGFGSRDIFTLYDIDTKIKEEEIIAKEVVFDREDVFLFDSDEEDIEKYKQKMSKKYKFSAFTDIHKLYDRGLSVRFGLLGTSENVFKDKALEKKIARDMEKIIKEEKVHGA